MVGLDNMNQYIDWWHEALPGSGEGFDHEGTVDGVHFTDLGFMRYADFLINQFKQLGLIE